ncbi:hypothetical protein P5V15_012910 [Pogonomyrmex californicus]
MHSHISMVRGGHRKYLLELDQHKCARLHETSSIVLGNSVSIIGLLLNATNYFIVTLAGTINMNDSCKGSHFSDPYGTMSSSKPPLPLHCEITLRLQEQRQIILHSAQKFNACFQGTNVSTKTGGNIYWAPLPVETCNFHAYNVLYQGQAYKIADSNTQYPIVYSLIIKDVTFALFKKSEYNVCGYTLI